MISKILLLAFVVGTAIAGNAIGRLPAKPRELAHKPGCYIDIVKDVIPFGSTITPLGECISISCSNEYINYDSCGVVGVSGPECHVTETDLSKPYPACCPKIKCN